MTSPCSAERTSEPLCLLLLLAAASGPKPLSMNSASFGVGAHYDFDEL